MNEAYPQPDGWVICTHCGTIWRAVWQGPECPLVCPDCYDSGAVLVPDEIYFYSKMYEEDH